MEPIIMQVLNQPLMRYGWIRFASIFDNALSLRTDVRARIDFLRDKNYYVIPILSVIFPFCTDQFVHIECHSVKKYNFLSFSLVWRSIQSYSLCNIYQDYFKYDIAYVENQLATWITGAYMTCQIRHFRLTRRNKGLFSTFT